MFKKVFSTKTKIAKFKKDYSEGLIHSEPVVNLSHKAFQNDNKEFKEWSDAKTNNPYLFIVDIFRTEYLLHTYGKCDFKFRGNRVYSNYLLEYKDNIFIVTSTTEAVINKNKDEQLFISEVAEFEKLLSSDILKFKIKDLKETNSNPELLEKLLSIKTDEHGNINWEYKKAKKLKM